jgi:predicted transcriptional regulator
MDHQLIINVLQQLGFSEKESSLYLANLEHGLLTAGQLAKKTGINRSTSYHLLYNLQQKNLVKTVFVNGLQLFKAEPPQTLLEELEEQEITLQQKKQLIQQTLPAFQDLHTDSTSEEGIVFYSGKEAVEKMYQGLDWTSRKFFGVFSPGRLDKLFGEESYWGTYSLDILKQQYADALITKTAGTSRFKRVIHNLEAPTTPRLLGNEELATDLMIFPDQVVMVDLKDHPTAVVLKNKLLLQSYQHLFKELWKVAA